MFARIKGCQENNCFDTFVTSTRMKRQQRYRGSKKSKILTHEQWSHVNNDKGVLRKIKV
jgi:hypothetical protein